MPDTNIKQIIYWKENGGHIMSNIHKSIAELVGHTPLLELVNFEENNNLKAKVLGKLEYFNPSGSVKDRAALEMLEAAEASADYLYGAGLHA